MGCGEHTHTLMWLETATSQLLDGRGWVWAARRTGQESALPVCGISAAVEDVEKPRQACDLDFVETVQKGLGQDARHAHDHGRFQAQGEGGPLRGRHGGRRHGFEIRGSTVERGSKGDRKSQIGIIQELLTKGLHGPIINSICGILN